MSLRAFVSRCIRGAILVGATHAHATDAGIADRDSDRIADADDRCPDEPETYNGRDDADGCPDKSEPYPAVVDSYWGTLSFAAGASGLSREANDKLDIVVTSLRLDAKRVEVQGYRDSREKAGLDLRRAKVVRAALIRRGVRAELISVRALGFGPTVCKSITPGCLKQQRLVVFAPPGAKPSSY